MVAFAQLAAVFSVSHGHGGLWQLITLLVLILLYWAYVRLLAPLAAPSLAAEVRRRCPGGRRRERPRAWHASCLGARWRAACTGRSARPFGTAGDPAAHTPSPFPHRCLIPPACLPADHLLRLRPGHLCVRHRRHQPAGRALPGHVSRGGGCSHEQAGLLQGTRALAHPAGHTVAAACPEVWCMAAGAVPPQPMPSTRPPCPHPLVLPALATRMCPARLPHLPLATSWPSACIMPSQSRSWPLDAPPEIRCLTPSPPHPHPHPPAHPRSNRLGTAMLVFQVVGMLCHCLRYCLQQAVEKAGRLWRRWRPGPAERFAAVVHEVMARDPHILARKFADRWLLRWGGEGVQGKGQGGLPAPEAGWRAAAWEGLLPGASATAPASGCSTELSLARQGQAPRARTAAGGALPAEPSVRRRPAPATTRPAGCMAAASASAACTPTSASAGCCPLLSGEALQRTGLGCSVQETGGTGLCASPAGGLPTHVAPARAAPRHVPPPSLGLPLCLEPLQAPRQLPA